MERSKRKELTVREKLKIIDLLKSKRLNRNQIKEIYKCDVSTISRILRSEEKLRKISNPGQVFRTREGPNEIVNIALAEWFHMNVEKGVPMSGAIIKAQAVKFAKQLNAKTFTPSNGWIWRWHKKYNTSYSHLKQKIREADRVATNEWNEKRVRQLLDGTYEGDSSSFDDANKNGMLHQNLINVEPESEFGREGKTDSEKPLPQMRFSFDVANVVTSISNDQNEDVRVNQVHSVDPLVKRITNYDISSTMSDSPSSISKEGQVKNKIIISREGTNNCDEVMKSPDLCPELKDIKPFENEHQILNTDSTSASPCMDNFNRVDVNDKINTKNATYNINTEAYKTLDTLIDFMCSNNINPKDLNDIKIDLTENSPNMLTDDEHENSSVASCSIIQDTDATAYQHDEGPPKKIRLIDDKNDQTTTAPSDQFSVYGENVACRLRNCERDKQEVFIAQHNIDNILFKLSMGVYSQKSSDNKPNSNDSSSFPVLVTGSIPRPVPTQPNYILPTPDEGSPSQLTVKDELIL